MPKLKDAAKNGQIDNATKNKLEIVLNGIVSTATDGFTTNDAKTLLSKLSQMTVRAINANSV